MLRLLLSSGRNWIVPANAIAAVIAHVQAAGWCFFAAQAIDTGRSRL